MLQAGEPRRPQQQRCILYLPIPHCPPQLQMPQGCCSTAPGVGALNPFTKYQRTTPWDAFQVPTSHCLVIPQYISPHASSADHLNFRIAVSENPTPCFSLQQSITFSALWWGFSYHFLTSLAYAHFPLLEFCLSSRWPLKNTAPESNSFMFSLHTDSLESPLAFHSCPLSTKFNMNHIDFVLA